MRRALVVPSNLHCALGLSAVHWIDPKAIRAVGNWLKVHGAITLTDQYTLREQTGCTLEDIEGAIKMNQDSPK